MIEFMFGTACAVGLVVVLRGAGRHRRPWRRAGRTRAAVGRAATEVVKRRLDVDEEQEDIIDQALGDLRQALERFELALHESRAELASAFRGEAVDEAALEAVWTRHDDALKRARREGASALKQVHAVLDPDQRAQAADWLANARPAWR
jgi:Spy/CpxP family protein refolding chaperone